MASKTRPKPPTETRAELLDRLFSALDEKKTPKEQVAYLASFFTNIDLKLIVEDIESAD